MDEVDLFISTHLKGKLYQRTALIMVGFANLINNCYVILFSLVFPRVQKQFDLSTLQISLLGALNGLGGIAGSLLSAWLAKIFGRAFLTKTAMLAQTCLGIAIVYANSFSVCAFMWTINGVYIGFITGIIMALVVEIAPYRTRGLWMTIVSAFASLGRILAAGLCLLLINEGDANSWKLPIEAATIILGAMTIVFALLLEEPLRYLLISKNYKQFAISFGRITKFNRLLAAERHPEINMSEQVLEDFANSQKFKNESLHTLSPVKTLLSQKYLLLTIMMLCLITATTVIFIGQNLLLAFWYSDPSVKSNSELVITFSAELLSIATTSLIIDKVWAGRKKSLKFFSLTLALSFLSQYFVSGSSTMLLLFFTTRFLMKSIIIIVLVLIGESYPTWLRTSAMGLIFSANSFLLIGLPFLVLSLYSWDHYSVFLLFCGTSLLLFVCSIFVRKDKTQKSLDLSCSLIKGEDQEEAAAQETSI